MVESRLAKAAVRSQLARWEMKNCTPLWREARAQVKNARNTPSLEHFLKLRCGKSARVVAQSTFPSQNVQNTPGSKHFWQLRCRKSARRCGATRISKSKRTKPFMFGALLEVQISKKVHALVAQSTFPSQNVKSTTCSEHFWRLRCRKSARRCGATRVSKLKCTKHSMFGAFLEVHISDVEKVHAVVAWSTFPSQNVQSTTCSDHFWMFRCRSCGRRKGLCTLSKVSKMWGFPSMSKNDGRRGTFVDSPCHSWFTTTNLSYRFPIFWNFRHRLVRHYWYPTTIDQTLDGHVGTLSCCCKRRYILTRKNMFPSHPRLAVISQYISIRQHIQRPLYIWLPTIPHEISTLFHLILAILLGVFTCVFYLLVSYWLCVLHVPISGRRKNMLNSYLDCFSLSPVRPMLLSWVISCMYFPWFYDFIHKLQKKRRKLSGVAMTPLAPAAAAGTSLGWLGKLLNQLGWI